VIQRHTKVDVEVILSVSIPVLAVCTGASSLFTSTLFTTQNIASAALYCTFIAALAVLGWWLRSTLEFGRDSEQRGLPKAAQRNGLSWL